MDQYHYYISQYGSIQIRTMKVLGENYTKEDEEDMSVQTVHRIWVYQSRYRWEIGLSFFYLAVYI